MGRRKPAPPDDRVVAERAFQRLLNALTEDQLRRLTALLVRDPRSPAWGLFVRARVARTLRGRLGRADHGTWADVCRLEALGLDDYEIAETIGSSAGAVRSMRYRRRHGKKR